MRRKTVWFAAVLFFLLLLWIVSLDSGNSGNNNAQRNVELLERIQRGAKPLEVPAVNAKIDRVWKAIPGYNGLEVDVDKTYRLASQSMKDGSIPWVFREVEPRITLDDLPPQPIYKGNPRKPMVSIMINVAWGDEFLDSILKTLDENRVHATFFLDGTWLSRNRARAEELLKQGHELSNHAYSHPDMSRLDRAHATQEIVRTQRLLEQLSVHNTLFAPPSGDYDAETVDIAHQLGLRTILWTMDTLDWKHPAPQSIVQKVAQRVEPGSLILMHPTSSSAAALQPMIAAIKGKGLALGTVSELISSKRIPNIEAWSDF